MPITQACPADGELVALEIDRVATQYREAAQLLGYMRAVLGQVEQAAQALCAVPGYFDLDSAVGDQLTLIGKRLGWPRCHCVCDAAPVFGFGCPPGVGFAVVGLRIVGFGTDDKSATWLDCNDRGIGELCLNDDETYRGYLRARRYQLLGLYDVASLQQAARHLWGEAASVAAAGGGRVVVAPGRLLTDAETRQLPLAFRVLPIAPGIRGLIHPGAGPIFGFGAGWGGFCQGAQWLCPTDPHPYDCA